MPRRRGPLEVLDANKKAGVCSEEGGFLDGGRRRRPRKKKKATTAVPQPRPKDAADVEWLRNALTRRSRLGATVVVRPPGDWKSSRRRNFVAWCEDLGFRCLAMNGATALEIDCGRISKILADLSQPSTPPRRKEMSDEIRESRHFALTALRRRRTVALKRRLSSSVIKPTIITQPQPPPPPPPTATTIATTTVAETELTTNETETETTTTTKTHNA